MFVQGVRVPLAEKLEPGPGVRGVPLLASGVLDMIGCKCAGSCIGLWRSGVVLSCLDGCRERSCCRARGGLPARIDLL
jgi:hypothetical protein